MSEKARRHEGTKARRESARGRWHLAVAAAIAAVVTWPPAPAAAGDDDWVEFVEETDVRLVADPEVGVDDTAEKDVAWGDLDLDGDVDLVVVRKQPFTTTGRRRNVLFMNEGIAEGHALDGVLVDRTAEFASAADDGGQGFLDPTNDRDVVVVDVNGDGWLDVVTAVTLSDGQPQTISHPRVYVNLGEIDGVWQGLRYEQARIPAFEVAPRFNAVAAGDVTGDGFPDLYFLDSDSGGAPPGGVDLDDRLLANDGQGFFSDVSADAMTEAMRASVMGTAGAIADVNGDGFNDVIKSSSLGAPIYVAVIYNGSRGFETLDPVYSNAPYYVSAGDLNGDGRVDLVVTDHGVDRYLLNLGNEANGLAAFTMHAVSFQEGSDEGFGGNSLIADLDADGFDDVIIADMDIDLPGCSRRARLFRNLADPPLVTLQDQGTGGIPEAELTGTFDVAALDLDGDGLLDLVLGRCAGNRVWMNRSGRLEFSFPDGLPDFVPAGAPAALTVAIVPVGPVSVEPGTAALHATIDGGPVETTLLVPLDGNLYEGTLPASPCGSELSFWISAVGTVGGTFTSPPDAPAETWLARAADAVETTFADDLEGDVSGWVVDNDEALASGGWEAAVPEGTDFNGMPAAPGEDATPDPGAIAFVTGASGGAPGANDVDGGPTRLITPPFDVEGPDAVVTWARWMFSEGGAIHVPDLLTVDVSSDGGATWVAVPELATGGTGGAWETVSFPVADYVEPTADVRVRFSVSDLPNNSVTEAGIDDLRVEQLACLSCAADLDGDGAVTVDDLVAMILAWGPCAGACPADLDGDGSVDVDDLVDLILAWGPCA